MYVVVDLTVIPGQRMAVGLCLNEFCAHASICPVLEEHMHNLLRRVLLCNLCRQILAYMKDCLENPLSQDDDGLDMEPAKK